VLAAANDAKAVAAWARTSRRNHALAGEPSLWRRMCSRIAQRTDPRML
jgi:hypothetical protein